MTASAEYNAIAVTQLRLCAPPSPDACYAICKGQQNMATVNTISIYRARVARGLYVFHIRKITRIDQTGPWPLAAEAI